MIVLLVTSGGVSIGPFGTVIGVPVGIVSASLSLAFSLRTGLVKKSLKLTRNKKKKHNLFKYKTMLSYCLKCKQKKNTESIN